MSNTEAVVAILVVGMTVGLPLWGLTVRFSLKPMVDAYVRVREAASGAQRAEVDALRARVAALEARLGESGHRGAAYGVTSELVEAIRLKD